MDISSADAQKGAALLGAVAAQPEAIPVGIAVPDNGAGTPHYAQGAAPLAGQPFRTTLWECSAPGVTTTNCLLAWFLPCWSYARTRALSGIDDAWPPGGWGTALGASLLLFGARYFVAGFARVVVLGAAPSYVLDIALWLAMLALVYDLRRKFKAKYQLVTRDCGSDDCDDLVCSALCGCCVLMQMANHLQPGDELDCALLSEPQLADMA